MKCAISMVFFLENLGTIKAVIEELDTTCISILATGIDNRISSQ